MAHPKGARAIRELLEADDLYAGEKEMEVIEGIENMSVLESRIEDLTSEDWSIRGNVIEAFGQRGDAKAAGSLIRALRAVAGYVREVTVGDRRNVLRIIILGMLGIFYGFLVVLMLL